MRFRIEMEIVEPGVKANGRELVFAKGWSRRMSNGWLSNSKHGESVFDRPRLRKSLKENYGIALPRGANPGDKWTIEFEGQLFAFDESGLNWEVDDFSEPAHRYGVYLTDDDYETPVSASDLIS